MSLRPGATIAGRYRLDRTATTDLTAAQAWDGRDLRLGRPVRVLVLSGQTAPAALSAARLASPIVDPGLVQLYDAGTAAIDGGSKPYIVSAPYSGRSLAQVVADGLLDAAQARALVGEAAQALRLAAVKGMRHLTLRPEAIRIDGRRVFVTGLGIDAALAGIRAEDQAGQAADTKDLAALGYFALTARWAGRDLTRLPLIATSQPMVVRRDAYGLPIALEDLVPHVDPVFSKTISGIFASATDAPTTIGALAEALQPWGSVVPPIKATVPESAQDREGHEKRPSGRIPRVASVTRTTANNLPTPAIPPRVHTGSPPPLPDVFTPVVAALTPAQVARVKARKRRKFALNPAPIVVPLVLAAVVGAAWWAMGVLRSPDDEAEYPDVVATEPGYELTPTPTPTPTLVLPVIEAIEQKGDAQTCGERPEDAPYVIDGDPTTYWYTCGYRSSRFGGLRDGIGLTITLREDASITEVTLLTNSTGGNVQILAGASADPATAQILAEGPVSPNTVFTLDEPFTTDSFTIWINDLPTTTDGAGNPDFPYRLQLFEATVE
ncbi:MAG: hypothetical protein FWD83_08440 [Promicromonosporaceae bacterium]|nr:hypothetical protein [Promicromonosporaceae bacterium]